LKKWIDGLMDEWIGEGMAARSVPCLH